MKETTIVELKKTKVTDGILLTGLPGIGLIGRVVGKYLVEELKAEKIAEMYSPHFPHQVIMTKKGGMRPIKNKFYYVKTKKANLVILVGDVQAMTPEGQYEVTGKVLDYIQKIGVKKIVTIGGYSTGKLNEKRHVFGVVTHKALIPPLKKLGVVFGVAKGAIVGAAGLLPAMGKLRGLKGACLMGETHGGYVDITAAKNIVLLLSNMFDIKIDLRKIEDKAKEGEKVLKRIEEEVQKNQITPYEPTKKDVSYIR